MSDVLTVAEAAQLLRMGRNQVYEACTRGELPHRRIGRSIRLSRTALLQWLGESGDTRARSCGAASDKGHS